MDARIRIFRLIPLICLIAATGCETRHGRGYAGRAPAEFSARKTVGLREILDAKRNVVGYVETQLVRPGGSLVDQEQYVVLDRNANRLGIVTERGESYRYEGGELVSIGNFTLRGAARRLLGEPDATLQPFEER